MTKKQFIKKLKTTPIDEIECEEQDNLFDLIDKEWKSREIDSFFNLISDNFGYSNLTFSLEPSNSSEYCSGDDDMTIKVKYFINDFGYGISGQFYFTEVPMYYKNTDEIIDTLLECFNQAEIIRDVLH